MQEYCDWCFGTLTQEDRTRPANELLNQVDAYACSRCLREGRVLVPPESLDTAPDVWKLAVVAVYDGDPNALAMLRQAAGYADGPVVVSTERLGTPGRESGWLERRGYVQGRVSYPNEPEVPTATCHVQPRPGAPALCGFPWERLVAVPRTVILADVAEELRCPKCLEASRAT